MLEWKVKKNSGNNDFWQSQNHEIYQTILNNCIVYVPYDKSTNQPVGTYNTLQEAKQSCEPIEKPYEVGYFEERKWGNFTVLEKGDGYLIKKLFIKKGCSISYQYHEHRSEEWIVLKGLGDFKTQLHKFEKRYLVAPTMLGYWWDGNFKYKTSGDIVTRYGAGTYIQINPKQYHKWTSVEDTEILEVWRGQDLRESDIVRLD